MSLISCTKKKPLHTTLADLTHCLLATCRLLHLQITPVVVIPFEEAVIPASQIEAPSSPEPLPIPPCGLPPVQTTSSSLVRTASPASYFEPSVHTVERHSPSPTPSVVSETSTAAVVQVYQDNQELEKEEEVDDADYLIRVPQQPVVNQGWANLNQTITQSIVDNIHSNPVFFDLLVEHYRGQEMIFGTTVEAWRGLHIVCRNLECCQAEQLAKELEPRNVPNHWEEYILHRERLPAELVREEELFYPEEYRH